MGGAISRHLHDSLTGLQLDLRMCGISDDGLTVLSEYLPSDLKSFDFCFGRNKGVTKAGADCIQARFPDAVLQQALRIMMGSVEEFALGERVAPPMLPACASELASGDMGKSPAMSSPSQEELPVFDSQGSAQQASTSRNAPSQEE